MPLFSCPPLRPPLVLLESNMQRGEHKMAEFHSKISDGSEMGAPTCPTMEMREIVTSAVKARSDLGKAEAVHRIARELGITPRRVLGILHGEVARIWADEIQTARTWYAEELEHQANRLTHQAELYRVRRAALMERHPSK
jgi:hypothetical protein